MFAEKQLLFGLLALQNNFATREALLAAFATWVTNKQRALSEILAEQGQLNHSQVALLLALTDAHLQQHNDDPRQSLSAVSSIGSLRDELRKLDDEQLDASLAGIRSNEGKNDPYATEIPLASESSATGQRYRILRPHARGGLGEVFVAQDLELHREVALKEIQLQYADREESRSRFVLEAEVTGGLEHPGIVPVYGLGRYADGRPFYAMRFIQGDSLKDALERFHRQGSGTGESLITGERGVEFRNLLRRFMDVCNAVEYAHCRGVLHRDLKPGNVMLGKYGETLVVDWGLARAHGKSEEFTEGGEDTLRPTAGSAVEPTQLGRAIGTPAFMSPEQAAGKLDQVGPATDVYSLGATLYMILTGQPPFVGKDVGETLRNVQLGHITPPRSVNRQVPAALDSICRKAMALRPADRYRSALALAEEVEHWLADEPVQAHRENLLGRASRWTRKHRSSAVSGVVAIILVATVSTAATVIVHGQKELIAAKEQRTRQLADSNQKLAKDESEARRNAEAARDREKLAHDAAVELAREKAQIAEEQRLEAEKSRRLADFLVSAFQAADPIANGGVDFYIPKGNGDQLTARQILDNGAARLRNDKELDRFPLSKAAMMNEIGNVYRQLGLWKEAQPLLVDALQIRLELLPPEHPDIAVSCHSLGWYYHERGDYQRAEPYYRKALAIREKIPGDVGKRLSAATMQNLAWMAANDRQYPEAEQLFKRSLDIRRELHGELHRELIYSKLGIAFVLIEQKKFAEALLMVMTAKAEFSQVEDNPHLQDAVTGFALGVIYRGTTLLKASETQLRKAIEAVNAGLGPDNFYVGLIQYELGATLQELGEIEEAESNFRGALKIAREKAQLQHPRIGVLIKRYTTLMASQQRIMEAKALWDDFINAQRERFGDDNRFTAEAICQYGIFLREINDHDGARMALLMALPILERRPVDREYRIALNEMGLCTQDSDPIAAESYFRRVLAASSDSPLTIQDFLTVRNNLASALLDQQKWDEAETILLEVQQQASQLSGQDQIRLVKGSLEFLTLVYLGKSVPTKASETIEARSHFANSKSEDLYLMATQLARCATLVTKIDGELDTEQRTQQTAYIERALTNLREALAAGLKNVKRIKKENSFAIMHDHPEFQSILSEADATSSPR